MSKEKEALKLALEGLEEIHPGNMTPMAEGNWNKAITTIREALAEQPAQQQEAVAWIVEFDDGHIETTTRPVSDWKRGMWESAGKRFTVKPLYTSPPASKPWVGLTVDEFYDLDDVGRKMILEYGRAVEAKLREKNAC